MKPAALTVSVSAAVIAKPQPRGVSLQAAWKTTTTKETFGQDRNSILCWFILLPLSSLLLIPSCALPFLPHPHLFPFISMLAMLLLLVPLIPTFPMYSQFFPPHPTSIFFFTSPPPSLPYIFFLPSSLPSSLLLSGSQAPAPHYVSLPGQCCQQLEHITANCATCGPLKGRKREGEGAALCQWRWGWCVCGGEVECCTAFWIPPQSTVFNYQ